MDQLLVDEQGEPGSTGTDRSTASCSSLLDHLKKEWCYRGFSSETINSCLYRHATFLSLFRKTGSPLRSGGQEVSAVVQENHSAASARLAVATVRFFPRIVHLQYLVLDTSKRDSPTCHPLREEAARLLSAISRIEYSKNSNESTTFKGLSL